MDFLQRYHQDKFLEFLKDNFLPNDFQQTTEHININDLSFKPEKIKKVKMIGQVPSLENLYVYEIEHESESDPRVTLSRETFRLMSNYGVRKALAIFISRNSHNYRFSLATIELKLDGSRVTKDYSNPRRYSFFLGPDAKVHTPTEYLITKGKIKDLNDLQNRFSIEVVTEVFFSELSNWYFWALKHVVFPKDAEKNKNGKNIALIRLITRLIFIWFMKQKGLIPNNLFNKQELDKFLIDSLPKESTYYKAILQNLFFATLNTTLKERKFRTQDQYKGMKKDFMGHSYYRYEQYFKTPDNIKALFNDIPFLNGGLFECLDERIEEKGTVRDIRIDGFSDREDNPLYVPDFLFFSEEIEVDLNKEYGTKGVRNKVKGIVNLLQLYNFTIDESTPVDVEIALDPELLGRVFENLLASYNPATATTARKATGSYYTPREIVNYMVEQSLKEYFKTSLSGISELDKKLEDLFSYVVNENPFNKKETDILINAINNMKVIDPAVGSGAFLMGILQKLVWVLSKLDPHNKKWEQQQIEAIEKNVTDVALKKQLIEKTELSFQENELDYGRKLYLIKNCIYGADLQPIAIQIAKLRFFISLLVNENLDAKRDNCGIEPLPNLETKLLATNSLIELKTKGQMYLFLDMVKIDSLEKEIKEIRDLYFSASHTRQKEKLKKKDKELRQKLAELLKQNAFPVESAEMIIGWDPYSLDTVADWFDPEWMFGVKNGFDIIIANPPYIKEYTNKEAFDGLRESPYYQGKMDLWYLFACKGIDLLKKDTGLLTFIAQNNWGTSYGASIMREKVIKETQITALIDFCDYKIFKTAGIQTMIMIFKADKKNDDYAFDYRRLTDKDADLEDVLDLINQKENSKVEYITPVIKRIKYLNKPLTFSCSNNEVILEKILEQRNFILDEKEVAQGIVYPQDYVNKETQKVLGNKFSVGDGIFVLSNEEKKSIPFTKNELELIKPAYTTRELGRYYGTKRNSEWVIYTGSEFKDPEKIKPYPNIKKHLDKFQKVITSDNKPYGLHRGREEKFFKEEKIVAARKCISPTFTYTYFDCYVSATFYVIKTERVNLKYLTALLNSKLIAFWLKNKGKMQGQNYQLDKEPLLALPLKTAPKAKQKQIIDIVDMILSISEQYGSFDKHGFSLSDGANGKIQELESQIDQMVYKLYDLADEEIKIVKGFEYL